MGRRWVLELEADGSGWREKRFYTRAGATVFMALIKWASTRYTMYLSKEPKR